MPGTVEDVVGDQRRAGAGHHRNSDADTALAEVFKPVAEGLRGQCETILAELLEAQGKPQDIGGYYLPDPVLTDKAMRPSATLNAVLARLG